MTVHRILFLKNDDAGRAKVPVNKDSKKRLFIEVDACNEGWGCCVYQYAGNSPTDIEDEGRYHLHSKEPK